VFAKVLLGQDGRSRGCGIVEFDTPERAADAIAQFHDSELLGRKILCRLDRRAPAGGDAPVRDRPPRVDRPRAAGNFGAGSDSNNGNGVSNRAQRPARRANAPVGEPVVVNAAPSLAVYIGNVAWSSTSDEIQAVVTAQAKVTPRSVDLPRDRKDRARGFAIAKFETIDQANTVINALNGVEVGGRVLHVRFDAFNDKKAPSF
jgi:RNA recognition motif-containing protein